MKKLLALFTVGVLWCISCGAQDTAPLYRAFVKPPDDARVMVRWWWFGSSVTKAELDREMRRETRTPESFKVVGSLAGALRTSPAGRGRYRLSQTSVRV